ncbi:molybdenum ABC transporter ATP-binding protein [Breoghania sp. L-A4]|uniref:molybdenum ABC transporter ATP-binding protein n=1 Tax=Breoghania sp. L-A4 TaxID=2304600 RepID=UPI000E35C561|nr:molybdenum ABC transporter ATP-binding protein [Breoghania sp. L-A4]AXS41955.1 molybdenum ABC transporter ATP-binding protein [Breoghania sp. L-A4]
MLSVDIRKRLGTFDIDARFQTDAAVSALFGQSGSGKTTIVNMIAGLVTPDEGRIELDGQVLFDSARRINVPVGKRRLGHVFQESRLFPHLTVRQNLTFAHWAGRRRGTRPLDEVVELLAIAPLLERRPGRLSGGERQRVAIGRALLADPRVLLMDEPLASLDQARKAEILPYLDRLRREAGIPIVYVSHALDEVARLAETLVIVSGGRIMASGPLAEIMTRLDLGPATGRHEAGGVLEGVISGFDARWGLHHLDIEGRRLEVPALKADVGDRVRLRIRARDVAIALEKPAGLSIRNMLDVEIIEITEETGPYAEVLCALGEQRLRARLTRASVVELGLAPGLRVQALVKSIAVDRPLVIAGGEAAPL